ncbi:20S-pre-rRNA D-site endonuclease nob1 [Blastocladiella emersonii ATCC 22665]|nr:20S-pre-rRNA D-site endonuclease nob1 [Blastocladiella emersonii ATCC 22665]
MKSTTVPKHKTRILVLDTAPLIKQAPLYHLASDRVVTIPDVLDEVRDARAREALARLPFTIDVMHPSADAIAAVSAFAKKTGDFPSLSLTDLRVLALTWQLTQAEEAAAKKMKEEARAAAIAAGEPVDEEAEQGEGADAPKKKKKRNRRKNKMQAEAAAAAEAGADAAEAADAETETAEPATEEPAAAAAVESAADEDDGFMAPKRKKNRARRPAGPAPAPRKPAVAAVPAPAAAAPAPVAPLAASESAFGKTVTEDELQAQLDAMALEGDDDEEEMAAPAAVPEATEETAVDSSLADVEFRKMPGFVEADSDNEEDMNAGWITPSNVERAKEITLNGSRTAPDAKVPDVSCMTDDFAVQNVLLQMGMHLLSLDGMHVRRLKNWLLRCHACFRTTTDMDKRFCPSCGGGNTLIRTSYTIENGELKLHLKKNFQYRLRGNVYSIPTNKGGRGGDSLVLREDQHEFQVRMKNYEHLKKKQAKQEWDEKLFGDGPLRPPSIGHGRKNPNEAVKMRK